MSKRKSRKGKKKSGWKGGLFELRTSDSGVDWALLRARTAKRGAGGANVMVLPTFPNKESEANFLLTINSWMEEGYSGFRTTLPIDEIEVDEDAQSVTLNLRPLTLYLNADEDQVPNFTKWIEEAEHPTPKKRRRSDDDEDED